MIVAGLYLVGHQQMSMEQLYIVLFVKIKLKYLLIKVIMIPCKKMPKKVDGYITLYMEDK